MRTRLGISLAASGLVAAAGLSNMSCSTLDCGQGTVERDGTCVPANADPDDAECGPGTVLGPNGCEPEVPTVCDPMTTEAQYDPETGVTTCVGVGGTGCAGEIPGCNSPDTGKATLCGRLWDAQTDQPIVPTSATDASACTTVESSGPCQFSLKVYDALDFAMNPTGAVPLAPANAVTVDHCGRYKAVNFPRATFGFIGIAVDDVDGTDDHRLTGVATSNAFASPGVGFRAYVTRNDTDTAWSAVLGGGQTFVQRGVLAIVFHHQGMPKAGVQVRRNGATIPADDYYFTDTGITRNTVDATPTVTGANGSVLVVNSPTPIAHDGVGAEPSGCQWPSNLAASIPGVSFIQIKDAEMPGGAACP